MKFTQINLISPISPINLTFDRSHSYRPLVIVPAAESTFWQDPASARVRPESDVSKTIIHKLGLSLVALSLGGLVGPWTPEVRLETGYYLNKAVAAVQQYINPTIRSTKPLPPAAPVILDPLKTPDGSSIDPVNREFSLIVPSVGINAPVISGVDPTKPGIYKEALEKGVAHSSLSFLPNENGTVYLFSHSTNYDWFVKDLNAIFYLLKNVQNGQHVVVFYKGVRYTYRISGKKVVKPRDINYLVPKVGESRLILQTCWPPGSVSERLLIFADLTEEYKP